VPEQARVLARVQELRLVLERVQEQALQLVQVRALVQALRLVLRLVLVRCASMRARRCSRARLRA
jgi:hypothetical protein